MWRDYRLTRMFPHWSMEYIREQPVAWVTAMLTCDVVSGEVSQYNAEQARKRAAQK